MDSRDKRSVFKLSGNMALGTNMHTPRVPDTIPYSSEELTAAKNSLRLLKAKQAQRQSNEYQRPSEVGYSSHSSHSKYATSSMQDAFPIKNKRQLVSEQYKMRGNPRGVYQLSSPVDQELGSYNRQPTNAPVESRRRQNVSKKKYEEQAMEKPTLPPRQRQGQVQTKSTFEDKPISQLKGNSDSLPQQYADDTDLAECKAGCGRSFKPSVLRTHEKVCKKVFQTKRKQFNAQSQRIVQKQQVKLMKKGSVVAKKVEAEKTKVNQKMPKWKLESLQFRNVLKANSNKGPMSVKEQQEHEQLQSAIKEASGFIQCPSCGRSFNETAGKRHMPVCAQKAKKNKFKK